jgi:3',5'-cyclic-nucleotide phosphodiesterase
MKCIAFLLPFLLSSCLIAQSFTVVPLGIRGGIDENNLSAYLLAPKGTANFICLDAGTIHAGIEKANRLKTFRAEPSVVLKRYIKGYCISHAHLDHVAGLIINSPDDSNKAIYAIPSVMQMLQNSYFNGDAWSNFGDAGKSLLIKKYHYETLEPAVEDSLRNTGMMVTAFPLSHVNPYESTAFLVRKDSTFVLYLGDTGCDSLENSDRLQQLWKQIAALVATNKLTGIFIEVSFPDEQPSNKLFGHLTPKLLMQEMNKLASIAGKEKMSGFKVVITHMKPPSVKYTIIKNQLVQQNKLGLKLLFPEQGKAFTL